jgi:hypothetical protein
MPEIRNTALERRIERELDSLREQAEFRALGRLDRTVACAGSAAAGAHGERANPCCWTNRRAATSLCQSQLAHPLVFLRARC